MTQSAAERPRIFLLRLLQCLADFGIIYSKNAGDGVTVWGNRYDGKGSVYRGAAALLRHGV